MLASIAFLVCIFRMIQSQNDAWSEWSAIAIGKDDNSPVLPIENAYTALGSWNSVIFFLGGEETETKWIEYDIDSQTMADKATALPAPVYFSGAGAARQYFTQIANIVYYLSGTNQISSYTLETNAESLAHGVVTSSIPSSVDSVPCITHFEQLLFVLGGWAGTTDRDEFQIYDILADEWTQGPPMLFRRRSLACAVDTRRKTLYNIGGWRSTVSPQNKKNVEKITLSQDVSAESWSNSNFLTYGGYDPFAMYDAFFDVIIVIGASDDPLAIQVIDCETGGVSVVPQSLITDAKQGATPIIVYNELYIFGGKDGGVLYDTWQYIRLRDATQAPTKAPSQVPTMAPTKMPTAEPSNSSYALPVYIQMQLLNATEETLADTVEYLADSIVFGSIGAGDCFQSNEVVVTLEPDDFVAINQSTIFCNESDAQQLKAYFDAELEYDVLESFSDEPEFVLVAESVTVLVYDVINLNEAEVVNDDHTTTTEIIVITLVVLMAEEKQKWAVTIVFAVIFAALIIGFLYIQFVKGKKVKEQSEHNENNLADMRQHDDEISNHEQPGQAAEPGQTEMPKIVNESYPGAITIVHNFDTEHDEIIIGDDEVTTSAREPGSAEMAHVGQQPQWVFVNGANVGPNADIIVVPVAGGEAQSGAVVHGMGGGAPGKPGANREENANEKSEAIAATQQPKNDAEDEHSESSKTRASDSSNPMYDEHWAAAKVTNHHGYDDSQKLEMFEKDDKGEQNVEHILNGSEGTKGKNN